MQSGNVGDIWKCMASIDKSELVNIEISPQCCSMEQEHVKRKVERVHETIRKILRRRTLRNGCMAVCENPSEHWNKVVNISVSMFH